MSVHEKIKFIRQARGLTQEDVANKLAMSVNGYGDIERGETDVNLSRLEQIAQLFEIKLSDLFDLEDRNIINSIGIGTNNQNYYCSINSCSPEYLQLKAELEKAHLIIQQGYQLKTGQLSVSKG
jgi:transcriptional regulator with XRE-family HTH domain